MGHGNSKHTVSPTLHANWRPLEIQNYFGDILVYIKDSDLRLILYEDYHMWGTFSRVLPHSRYSEDTTNCFYLYR